jgi:hypothetical protein
MGAYSSPQSLSGEMAPARAGHDDLAAVTEGKARNDCFSSARFRRGFAGTVRRGSTSILLAIMALAKPSVKPAMGQEGRRQNRAPPVRALPLLPVGRKNHSIKQDCRKRDHRGAPNTEAPQIRKFLKSCDVTPQAFPV